MNKGELDELKCKIYLTYLRDSKKAFFGNQIRQLGNTSGQNYSDFDMAGHDIAAIKRMDERQIEYIAQRLGISKSPTRAKADVFINGIGISLKSLRAAPPAIVNHTARPGFEAACQYANVNIDDLDTIIARYWELRLRGIIAEDTKINDPYCPFNGSQNVLRPVLEYFLFSGTGSGLSEYPAQAVLEFDDPFDVTAYRILDPEQTVDDIWDNLVFSLRAKKGMPKNYDPETYSGINAASIAKWVEYIDGDYRGALHIRTRRG